MTKPNPPGTKLTQGFFRAKFGRKMQPLRKLLEWRESLPHGWLRAKPPVGRI